MVDRKKLEKLIFKDSYKNNKMPTNFLSSLKGLLLDRNVFC